MVDFIKKQWFVLLIGLVFLIGIGYYVVDQQSSVVKGKQVNGEDIVFSIDGKNFTADDFYKELKEDYEVNLAAMRYQIEVVEQTMTLTEDEIVSAKLNVEEFDAVYQQQFGKNYKEYLGRILISIGFDGYEDLDKFSRFTLKYNRMLEEYLDDNLDPYWTEYEKQYKPRILSHILVRIADTENITTEEQEKLDAVKEALAQGESFSAVAKEYSDDGSGASGGSLGLATTSTSYVKEFKDAAFKLQEGEVTDWVETEYGFHLIKVDVMGYENLMASETTAQTLLQNILTNNNDFIGKALQRLIEDNDLKITFANAEIEEAILRHYGLIEDEVETPTTETPTTETPTTETPTTETSTTETPTSETESADGETETSEETGGNN